MALRTGRPLPWRWQMWGLASVLALCGCALGPARVVEKGMTCAEAQRLATAALGRLGYLIDSSTRPTTATPGVVTGTRTRDGSEAHATVRIVCTPQGAEVEASGEGRSGASLELLDRFKDAFAAAAAARTPPRAAAPTGLDILLVPQRAAATPELPVDLSDTGLLPVRVRITNRSSRVYRFVATDIVLITSDGERVSVPALDATMARVPDPGRATVRAQALVDQDIRPGETLTGLVLAPFKPYAKARVLLTDVESGESEGFAFEF